MDESAIFRVGYDQTATIVAISIIGAAMLAFVSFGIISNFISSKTTEQQ